VTQRRDRVEPVRCTLAAYRNLQQAWGKPLIFTEIGYRSGDGAGGTGYNPRSKPSEDVLRAWQR
jgi:hypothetical protein